MYLSDCLTGLSDSRMATTGFEFRRMIMRIVGLIILLVLFFTNKLTILTYFFQNIFVFLIILISGVIFLRHKNIFKFSLNISNYTNFKPILKHYITYSHPLLTLALFSFIFSFFDRWFLQVISGSVSQGYFSLAFGLSTICILFTGAMIPIFRQMITKAHGEKNVVLIQELFHKGRLLYFISAFLSFFFIFHSNIIINLIGGSQYSSANITLLIMFFYPIHQTYGQLCGAMLLSQEKTSLYRNIGIFTAILGFIISYFLLAPSTYIIPGCNLGATGLAIKFVLIQVIFVNIELYFVTKNIGLSFYKYLIYQVLVLIPIIIIGMIDRELFKNILNTNSGILFKGFITIISGFFMFLLAAVLCWFFPFLIGMKRYEIIDSISKVFIWSRITRKP